MLYLMKAGCQNLIVMLIFLIRGIYFDRQLA